MQAEIADEQLPLLVSELKVRKSAITQCVVHVSREKSISTLQWLFLHIANDAFLIIVVKVGEHLTHINDCHVLVIQVVFFNNLKTNTTFSID